MNIYKKNSNGDEVDDDDVDHQNNKPTKEFLQKYCYHFDYPAVQESGYLELTNNKIVLSFPEKPTITVNNGYNFNQTVHIFVNKQLVFDFDWIPIYSESDYVKVFDVFAKTLSEYTYYCQGHYYVPTYNSVTPRYCSNIATVYNTTLFNLYCYESRYTTSIEIDVLTNVIQPSLNQNICIFQLCIGNNINLCTENTFKYLDTPSVHFIIQFILNKIINKY